MQVIYLENRFTGPTPFSFSWSDFSPQVCILASILESSDTYDPRSWFQKDHPNPSA